MTVILYLLVVLLSFIVGFLLGLIFPILPKGKTEIRIGKSKDFDDEYKALNEEYRNFLSYDGTVQS